MMQRREAANKTDEIMAQFYPVEPKPTLMLAPPLPPSTVPSSAASTSGAHKHDMEEDHNLRLLRTGDDNPLVRLSLVVPDDLSPALLSDSLTTVIPVEVPKVIAPRPTRPLRTTICIDSSNITGYKSAAPRGAGVSKKTIREVEVEVELDARPAIVSDGYNRVFMVNDVYKEMVGQPVCPWLDALPGVGASRRINGEVMLNVQTIRPASRLPKYGGAFPCTARISWEHDGAMTSLTVPCGVESLTGNSGNYRFIWRFDSARASITF